MCVDPCADIVTISWGKLHTDTDNDCEVHRCPVCGDDMARITPFERGRTNSIQQQQYGPPRQGMY